MSPLFSDFDIFVNQQQYSNSVYITTFLDSNNYPLFYDYLHPRGYGGSGRLVIFFNDSNSYLLFIFAVPILHQTLPTFLFFYFQNNFSQLFIFLLFNSFPFSGILATCSSIITTHGATTRVTLTLV